MANNLLQLNPTQANPNQQAYNNWFNSLIQSGNMAQNLPPETLLGMALGNALGMWGGWQAGNWWENSKQKKREQGQLEGQPANPVNNTGDYDSIQAQNALANQAGIPNWQRQYHTLWGKDFGRNNYDQYNNQTLEQLGDVNTWWQRPHNGESIGSYVDRMNLGSWRNANLSDITGKVKSTMMMYPFPPRTSKQNFNQVSLGNFGFNNGNYNLNPNVLK